jgi:cytochrome c
MRTFSTESQKRAIHEKTDPCRARFDRSFHRVVSRAGAGKSSFNKCLACHAIGEGAKNKVGPELNGLNGRKSGSAPGYSYSDANKNSGLTWDEATFKEYIKDPKAKIPGTKMAFAGIKKESEVNDLWAFLAQFDADGKIKP